jgi:hypothetical protein
MKPYTDLNGKANINMIDFNGNEITVGSTVFWLHTLSDPIIGKVSKLNGKKTFLVRFIDVIKFSKKEENWFNEYKTNDFDNQDTLDDSGYCVKSDCCIVVE